MLKNIMRMNLTDIRFYPIFKIKFSIGSTKNFTESNKQKKEINFTPIYKYKNSDFKMRFMFWAHMFYIYGNSALFYFELFEPTIGYFHGLMLTLSVSIGWASLFIISNVVKNTADKIVKFNDYSGKTKYKIKYLSFLKVVSF
jgi:hypothetical protein